MPECNGCTRHHVNEDCPKHQGIQAYRFAASVAWPQERVEEGIMDIEKFLSDQLLPQCPNCLEFVEDELEHSIIAPYYVDEGMSMEREAVYSCAPRWFPPKEPAD